jgi:GNAT superfamily N-acetyltransferase
VTTTLRPAAPEETGPDGARARSFVVRVNGREAGRVRLTTDPRHGPRVGVIDVLEIDEPDRRRGRGAVAALAAEEVLRGWGCRRARTEVPAGSRYGLRLAAALGYREVNRRMVKALTAPAPQPPGGLAIRTMSPQDYRAWFTRTRADIVRKWADEGLSPQQAVALADADYATLLPDGPGTEGTALRVLSRDGVDLGWLWLRIALPGGGAVLPWVYLIEIAAGQRGHGHGRTLMRVAEAECLGAGADSLGLNVFTDNVPAMSLYASLGYRPTTHVMDKPLT